MSTSSVSISSATNLNAAGDRFGKPARTRWYSQPTALRLVFWILGLSLACAQAWVYRYQTSADSISYLDMSDGIMPGGDWHRLINRTWNPLYPFLLGCFRRVFGISAGHEIVAAHLLNIGFFILAFVSFEIFFANLVRHASARDSKISAFGALPDWVPLSMAYSLFLWSAMSGISLEFLRPDMLLSEFLLSGGRHSTQHVRQKCPLERLFNLRLGLGCRLFGEGGNVAGGCCNARDQFIRGG